MISIINSTNLNYYHILDKNQWIKKNMKYVKTKHHFKHIYQVYMNNNNLFQELNNSFIIKSSY